MKDYKEILNERIDVASRNTGKDVEAMFFRLDIGEVINNIDHNLNHLSANEIKRYFRSGSWAFAKTRPSGRYHEWVFISKDKTEAIVLKVDVRQDSVISIRKRKVVM